MLFTSSNQLNFHVQSSRFTQFRVWRRRRLKFHKNTPNFSCKLGPLNTPNFENLFQNLISKLGFPSGSSLYLSDSKSNSNRNGEVPDFGEERILFTSPTPFNRFVLLRCPSISFQGSELLEDLNDRLLKEDRHFVKIISGRIQVEDSVVYQRTCVSTGDGGVISLDWPEKLDLMEEHGIDTTVLLVPGTVEGSMDGNIMSFVCELLKSGCFPVVMNPRGCAGSPLTTARLFTAADSDDICTAIQFINKARPGNTLISIGWGLGANMLTKYLAEVSEKTPLTAATCIDSPFDLEEATRSSPYHVAIDQKLTSGLVDILQSNKELFQGRPKRFDVEKALSATSLRDFEREISMISYGFESIEAFYSKSSTRELVENVKIPLLFIQSDEGMVPPSSIPRGAIAENSFTSLLLCSYLPAGNNVKEISVLPWCQHFAIEWLTAVELGFLKGRHPTLTDVDITINPSASLLVENKEHIGVNKYANITETDASNGHHLDPIDNDTKNEGDPVSQGRETGEKSEESGLDNDILVSETAEDEKSQVLQSVEAVMKMLDASMPGALEEEQKMKVMIAMEQGETLMRALEGAVPEDVWGNLTTGVSEIMQNQGSNLNFPGMMNDPPDSNASAVDTSKIQEETVNEGIDDVCALEDLVDEIPSGTDRKETSFEKNLEDKPQNVQVQSEYDEVGSELEEAKDSTVNKKEKVNADMDVSDDQNESSSISEMEEAEPTSGSPKVGDEDNQAPSNSEEAEPPVVPQAIDAVTKFNDSPQEAVNSVIGVAENVAAKLEESSGEENEKPQESSPNGENDESG